MKSRIFIGGCCNLFFCFGVIFSLSNLPLFLWNLSFRTFFSLLDFQNIFHKFIVGDLRKRLPSIMVKLLFRNVGAPKFVTASKILNKTRLDQLAATKCWSSHAKFKFILSLFRKSLSFLLNTNETLNKMEKCFRYRLCQLSGKIWKWKVKLERAFTKCIWK